jgi:hypothetical protein
VIFNQTRKKSSRFLISQEGRLKRGVTPTRDPGPGKTDSNVGKIKTSKNKSKKGKAERLVPPGKKAAPQEYVHDE